MATYQEILDEFFFVRFPRGCASLEEFEAEPGTKDRVVTRELLTKFALEAPQTAMSEFQIDYFPETAECIEILDEFLTPEIADRWIAESDPEDEDNNLKLSMCELAVHLGNTLIREYAGSWRYARFPNFFNSTVLLEHVEVHVLDMIIKKCSDDFRHERISEKIVAAIEANRP